MKGPMFRIHPWQNGFDLSITGHFLEVHVSEDDETCLYCCCDVTRGQGVKFCCWRFCLALNHILDSFMVYQNFKISVAQQLHKTVNVH